MLAPAEIRSRSTGSSTYCTAFNQRVLQLVHSAKSFDTNGYAIRTEQIINALRERNIESVVVSRFGYPWDLPQHMNDKVVPTTASDGIEYCHLFDPERCIGGPEAEYLTRYSDKVIEIATTSACSIIHAHSNYLNGLAANMAGAALGMPVVYEMRGLWHLTRATRSSAYFETEHYRYCENREIQAAKGAQAVAAISQPLAEWLVECGVEREKITVIGNACMNQSARVSVDDTKYCVGYIGSLVAYEGLPSLIKAMAIVSKHEPRAQAIIVGGGRCLAELKQQVVREGLAGKIVFTGPVSSKEALDYYKQLDAIVLPRLSNQLTEMIPPLKPMEALSKGVPVIASDVAPLRQVVTAGENGLVYPAGDHEELAKCILQIFVDKALRKTLSQNGLSWAAENSWESNAVAYERIYQGLHSQQSPTHSP